MQHVAHNINDLKRLPTAVVGNTLAAPAAMADQIAALGHAIRHAKNRPSTAHLQKIRQLAKASGFSTVTAVMRTLESELAGGGIRAVARYSDALQEALDIDSLVASGTMAVKAPHYQEALLASLALRMHG